MVDPAIVNGGQVVDAAGGGVLDHLSRRHAGLPRRDHRGPHLPAELLVVAAHTLEVSGGRATVRSR
jgi:hypothetical protein